MYLVTTPPKTHYPIIIKLLNNNKNVLVEKPLTISQEQVDKINKLTLNKKTFTMKCLCISLLVVILRL